MFQNKLRIIFRNITKHIIYVMINVAGLGLAFAVCIVAYLNYNFDADFDASQENGDRIFRIEHTRLIEGSPEHFAQSPCPLGTALSDNLGGVEAMVRIAMDLLENLQLFKAGENEKYGRLIFADPDFFEIFSFPLISGNTKSFREKNTIFISEKLARGIFGDQDPLGKILLVRNSPYTIGGVLENHPLNSSFEFDAVAPIQNWFTANHVSEFDWNLFIESTFILIRDPQQAPAIEMSLKEYIPLVNDVSWIQVDRFYLAPFCEMAHHAREVRGHRFRPSVHPALVSPPLIAAICILLIACFNFTNITIAMAGHRLKEIGIRKVAGGKKSQLVRQFMGETFLMSIFAFIFALFFARYLVSSFSRMWDFIDLSLPLTGDPGLWLFLFLLLLVSAILSGAYPAFYISSFSPVHIFREKLKLGGGNIFARILLSLQFSLSILALFTGATLIQNAKYQKTFDQGYDGDLLFEVWIEQPYLEIYKNAIRKYPEIESVSEAISSPFFNQMVIKYGETEREAKICFLGMDTYHTMGLRLIEGRPFEAQTENTDERGAVMVNRKFVEEFGMIHPLGETLIMNDTIPLVIIGVIEDIMEEGVWSKGVAPTFYRLSGEGAPSPHLLVRSARGMQQDLIQSLETEWNKLMPDLPFLGVEGNIYMQAAQDTNKNVMQISIFLVLIATLLSAAGLYSQVSLGILRRTKEMGIRKIHGASALTIMLILNYEFLLLLCISSFLGLVAGHYTNMALLDKIWAYHTGTSSLTFILPVILFFAISVLTVWGKVSRAAIKNPLDALRYE